MRIPIRRYAVISARPVVDIHCLVRYWDDPQKFAIEYKDGSRRVYVMRIRNIVSRVGRACDMCISRYSAVCIPRMARPWGDTCIFARADVLVPYGASIRHTYPPVRRYVCSRRDAVLGVALDTARNAGNGNVDVSAQDSVAA